VPLHLIVELIHRRAEFIEDYARHGARQGILDNADEGCGAEEITTEILEVPVDVVRRILAYASRPARVS
jgi:hypothetical protein